MRRVLAGLLGLLVLSSTGCEMPSLGPTPPSLWEFEPASIRTHDAPRQEEKTSAAEAQGRRARSSPPDLSGPLDLEQLLEIALAENPDLAKGQWATAAAEAERAVAAGQRWPAIGVAAGYAHRLDPQRLLQPREPAEPGVYGRDVFSGDLTLHVPLYTAGRLTSEIDAAGFEVRATEQRLERTREKIAFDVATVYYAILGQQKIIDSVEFSHQVLEQHQQRIEDLISVSKAARVDLLRTQVRLADIAQRLVREKNTRALLERLLANLLGRSGGATREASLEVRGELVLSATPVDFERALDRAMKRSDYRAARAALDAQARRLEAEEAGRWPEVSLEGSYGGRWAARATDHEAAASETEDVGMIAIGIHVPIFEGGAITARINREKARMAGLREELRKLELGIRLDVESALLDITSTRERVEATRTAVKQAEESLRIEREKYESGRGSITDVLDAQSALLDSQTNTFQALAEFNTALAELRFATGEEP